MNKYRKSGFSLVELMVVISIIGVLMAVGAVSYTTAQKKSRDSSRRSEMRAMQQALEQYYTENSYYSPVVGGGSDDCADLFTTSTFVPGGRPIDPKNLAPSFVYTFTCQNDTYCVCAGLENETGNSVDNACDYTGAGTKTQFCVSNQQ